MILVGKRVIRFTITLMCYPLYKFRIMHKDHILTFFYSKKLQNAFASTNQQMLIIPEGKVMLLLLF